MATLPAPRALLTSLVNSIALTPASESAPQTTNAHAAETSRNRQGETNALKLIPPPSRPLLTTLHVLFPTLLLPALDLLDRSLVTKVMRKSDTPETEDVASAHAEANGEMGLEPTKTSRHDHTANKTGSPPVQNSAEDNQKDHQRQNQQQGYASSTDNRALEGQGAGIFLVRSAASTSKRTYNAFGNASSAAAAAAAAAGGSSAAHGAETPYIVRLDAWNCSCANFAFDAFPAPRGAVGRTGFDSASRGGVEGQDSAMGVDDADGGREWDVFSPAFDDSRDSSGVRGGDSTWHFGGTGFDAGAPCCKHLLACLLVERWGPVLGRYAIEKRVGKEEMAGLVADT